MNRVRCFDNGGETYDRYTIVFTKALTCNGKKFYQYLAASEHPFHPQGFGQHGELTSISGDWSHLGKRVRFSRLPEDVKRFVLQEQI